MQGVEAKKMERKSAIQKSLQKKHREKLALRRKRERFRVKKISGALQYNIPTLMYFDNQKRRKCPSCGGKKTCEKYDDGHAYCFRCEMYFPSPDAKLKARTHTSRNPNRPPDDIDEIWASGRAVLFDFHPYLRRRGGIVGFGLRVLYKKLLAPIRLLTGKLTSIQKITSTGQKKLARGCSLGDGFFSIGKPGQKIYICEGVATALSIYAVTKKKYTVAAVSAGRLLRIARVIRNAYPDAEIVICADNDADKKRNVGLEKATEAARAIGAKLAAPDEAGDFNDLWQETDDDQLRRQLDAAVEVEPGQIDQTSGEITPSDVAFSDLFIKQHSKRVRYCEQGWLTWDDSRWSHDDHGQVQEMGKQTARSILDLSKAEPDVERASKLARWGANVLQKPRIDAGTALACSNPKIRVKISGLDADPLLLNVLNGTIDLRTNELRPHRRGDLITRLCPVEYDESAKCPRWEAFLDTTFQGSKSFIDFVQRAIGYSLTGDTSEQCLFICHGHGDNGKTVLLETMSELAADYAKSSSIETFMARGNRGGIPNDIARLAGVRVVTVGETPLYGAFNESLVKDVTGGDTITARFLRREFFDFRPQFKLWIRANHKPRIRGTDHGIWRRIRLIPFDVTIPKKDQDPYLLDKLRGELPGILNLAVQGCLAWQKHGLRLPTEVRHATKSYRSEQDVLGAYIKERIKKKGTSYIMARPLYEDYAEWCDANREKPGSENDFSAAMIERGFEKQRKKTGWRYLGINFRT